MLQASVGHPEPRERVGLKDGGHVLLKCSSCQKALVDIWITKPDDNIEWKLLAKCCYCGDESLPVNIKGRFAVAGDGINNPDDPDDAKVLTTVIRTEPVGDTTIFHTKKRD